MLDWTAIKIIGNNYCILGKSTHRFIFRTLVTPGRFGTQLSFVMGGNYVFSKKTLSTVYYFSI